MKTYTYLFMVALVFVLAAEGGSFVIPKPKKKQTSMPKLKAEIGDSYASLLKKQASIIERLAQTNRELVNRTEELLENNSQATVHQLRTYKEKLEGFEKKLDVFEYDARCMFDCLHKGIPS